MAELTPTQKQEIRDLVYGYFAEECGIAREKLTDATNIIEQLQGDSLMLLSLLETVRKKYGIAIELKTLGKHLMRKPANTLGQVIELTEAIVQYGPGVLNIDL